MRTDDGKRHHNDSHNNNIVIISIPIPMLIAIFVNTVKTLQFLRPLLLLPLCCWRSCT